MHDLPKAVTKRQNKTKRIYKSKVQPTRILRSRDHCKSKQTGRLPLRARAMQTPINDHFSTWENPSDIVMNRKDETNQTAESMHICATFPSDPWMLEEETADITVGCSSFRSTPAELLPPTPAAANYRTLRSATKAGTKHQHHNKNKLVSVDATFDLWENNYKETNNQFNLKLPITKEFINEPLIEVSQIPQPINLKKKIKLRSLGKNKGNQRQEFTLIKEADFPELFGEESILKTQSLDHLQGDMDYDTDEEQAQDNQNCLKTLLTEAINTFCKERDAIEQVENLDVDPNLRLGYQTPEPKIYKEVQSASVQTEDCETMTGSLTSRNNNVNYQTVAKQISNKNLKLLKEVRFDLNIDTQEYNKKHQQQQKSQRKWLIQRLNQRQKLLPIKDSIAYAVLTQPRQVATLSKYSISYNPNADVQENHHQVVNK